MRPRAALMLLLLALVPSIAAAQAFHRGDVVLQTVGDPSMNAWLYMPGAPWATPAGGSTLIVKSVPYVGSGRLFVASPTLILFHDRHIMSWWNGGFVYAGDPADPYTFIFSDDAVLTEIAPLRSGNFLVAEAPSDRGAKLIEFNLNGKVHEFAFGGANFIDLMSDQCTLLYTDGGVGVHRFNLCTRQTETDFVTLPYGETAGAVRQMPDGDVLLAAGDSIQEFHADGSFAMYYPFFGATHVALSPDGLSFYAAGAAQNHTADLRHYDPNTVTYDKIKIGNDGMQPPESATAITDLTVAGEWRVSMPLSRMRGVRRR